MPPVIKIDDLQMAGIGTCSTARDFCRRHKFNYDELRTSGIDADRVRHIDDQRSDLERLIAAASERERREADGQ